jgi:hypothetical protein
MKVSRASWIATSLLFAALFVPGRAAAQYGASQKYLGGHIGLSAYGSTAAFGVSGEVSYNDRIGIGAWLDYWSYGYSNFYDLRYIAVAGTGAYHFPVRSNPKLDPFAGLALGYFIVSDSYNGPGNDPGYTGSSSRIFLGGFGGIRYFFKPSLAGVARIGFGASYLTVGLDFRL